MFAGHLGGNGLRSLRIALGHFAQRRAGRILVVEGGKRHAELQEHFRRLFRGAVFLMRVQEGLGRIIVFTLRIKCFTKPEVGIGRAGAVRIAVDILAELLFGDAVVAGQNMAIGRFILIAFAAAVCVVAVVIVISVAAFPV